MANSIYQPTDVSQILMYIFGAIFIFLIFAIYASRFRPAVQGPEKGDITFIAWGEESFGGLTNEGVDFTDENTLDWLKDIDLSDAKKAVFSKLLVLCETIHLYGVRDMKIHKRASANVGKVLLISPRDLDEGNLKSKISSRTIFLPYPHKISETIVILSQFIDWGVHKISGVGTCRVVTGVPVSRLELNNIGETPTEVLDAKNKITASEWKIIKQIVPEAIQLSDGQQIQNEANATVEVMKKKMEAKGLEVREATNLKDFFKSLLDRITTQTGAPNIIAPKDNTQPIGTPDTMIMLTLAIVGYFLFISLIPQYVENIDPIVAGFIGILVGPVIYLWRKGRLYR